MPMVYSSTRREVRDPSRPDHIFGAAVPAEGEISSVLAARVRRVGLGAAAATSLSPSARAPAPTMRIPRAIREPAAPGAAATAVPGPRALPAPAPACAARDRRAR